MAIQIRFQGGPRAGQVLQFDDDVAMITIGRDAAQCDVVFPPDETLVGRQHCALRRELGRYRIVLNEENPVWLDGEIAGDEDELSAECDLQLGENGPVLVVQTQSNQALPSTANYDDKTPGTTTAFGDMRAATRRTAAVAALGLVLVLVVGGLTYLFWKQNQETDVAQERQLEVVSIHLAKEATVNEQQSEVLSRAHDKFAALDAKIDIKDRAMANALRSAAQSVYLVIVKDEYGNESTFATAWVIDQAKGILATNAHVAERFKSLNDDERLVARSSQADAREFAIQSVRIHPGYQTFQKLWTEYNPTVRATLTASDAIRMPGPACDVALMFVGTEEQLAPSLPLAAQPTLHSLAAGDIAGSVGFPSEGLVLGGVNKESPTPTTHMAYIISMVDYFGVDDTKMENRLLILHAIPAIGGASGSPIINRRGEVVAIHSAGNVIGQTASARIKSSARINMAQRADLLKELLEDVATEKQAARTTVWKNEIQRYYVKRTDADRDVSLDRRVVDWRTKLSRGGEYSVVTRPLAGSELPGNPKPAPQAFAIPAAGPFLFIASGEKTGRIHFDVYEMQDGNRVRRHFGEGPDDWLKSTALDVAHPGDVQIDVENRLDDTPIHLNVYRADVQARSIEERRQQIVARYERIFAEQGFAEVSRIEGRLQREDEKSLVASAEATISLKAAGVYLVVAVADEIQDLDMTLFREVDGVDEEFKIDRGPYSWAYALIRLDRATDLRALLVAEKNDSKFQLYVYHVPPRRD